MLMEKTNTWLHDVDKVADLNRKEQIHNEEQNNFNDTWPGVFSPENTFHQQETLQGLADKNMKGTLSDKQIAASHVMPTDLPVFSGKPEEWPLFINAFRNTTRTCGFSEDQNLIRL